MSIQARYCIYRYVLVRTITKYQKIVRRMMESLATLNYQPGLRMEAKIYL